MSDLTPIDMVEKSIHQTNKSGPLEVVKYESAGCVLVKFIGTGNSYTVRSSSIRRMNVKDYMAPIKCGVGYIGIGSYSQVNNKRAYDTWNSMIYRCYDERTQNKQPAYRECSVSSEWHDFQVFAEWFEANYVSGLHLDKDVKVEGNKVYGKDTCTFISRRENNAKAKAKEFSFISPAGVLVAGVNVSEFCRANGLDSSHMCNVSKGIRISHKGWLKG